MRRSVAVNNLSFAVHTYSMDSKDKHATEKLLFSSLFDLRILNLNEFFARLTYYWLSQGLLEFNPWLSIYLV